MSLSSRLLPIETDEKNVPVIAAPAHSPLVNLFVLKDQKDGIDTGKLGNMIGGFLTTNDRAGLKETTKNISGKVEFVYKDAGMSYVGNVYDVLFKPCCDQINKATDEENADGYGEDNCAGCICCLMSCLCCTPLTISSAIAIIAFPTAFCIGKLKNVTCPEIDYTKSKIDPEHQSSFKVRAPAIQRMR
jgi:hypothetical protein